MNGQWQPKTASKVLPISRTFAEIILLSLIGAFAVFLRVKLRIPLNMPGHHGLEVMALLLVGRQISKISIASGISTFAAAMILLLPWAGIKDPFIPLIYLIMGISIDLMHKAVGKWNAHAFILFLIGGFAYMMIPLSRLIINITMGYPYASFIKGGVAYTVFSHFIFGAVGGLAAYGLIVGTKKIRNL